MTTATTNAETTARTTAKEGGGTIPLGVRVLHNLHGHLPRHNTGRVSIRSRRDTPRVRYPHFGLHRPSRGTRNRQFFRRNPAGITALLVSVVLASSTLAAVTDNDPIFGICLAIVMLPVIITMNAGLLADLHSPPTHAKTHLGLLARKAGWTSVIGFILAILQFITGVANLQSANAFSLTIAALAGVGAWPHAIEAHYTGRRSVRRPTRCPMTRGRGATSRSKVQLNRRTSHGPTRTAGATTRA